MVEARPPPASIQSGRTRSQLKVPGWQPHGSTLQYRGWSAGRVSATALHSLCYESMRREIDFENITRGPEEKKRTDMSVALSGNCSATLGETKPACVPRRWEAAEFCIVHVKLIRRKY